MSRLLATAVLLSTLGTSALAFDYKDRPGAQDHPAVSRYPGSVLYATGSDNFTGLQVNLGGKVRYDGDKKQYLFDKGSVAEGKLSSYVYFGPTGRSSLEVFRNYQQALAKNGFSVVYQCEPQQCVSDGMKRYIGDLTYRVAYTGGFNAVANGVFNNADNSDPFLRHLTAVAKRPTGDVYVLVSVHETSREGHIPYVVQVLEARKMDTAAIDVNADALAKGLKAEGRIALDGVYFDSNKATLRPESQPQLREMAKLLRKQPSLKVFIVGHTDNQGAFDANQLLSQQRAQAVATELIKSYQIPQDRLIARGVANLSPVATNLDEAGRSRNRRVELVAQ